MEGGRSGGGGGQFPFRVLTVRETWAWRVREVRRRRWSIVAESGLTEL